MTLLQHEIDAIADRILDHISGRLTELVRSTIREELKMTDQAILDLTAATNSVVTEVAALITEVQSEANALAAALAASGATNDPAIEAQVARLTGAATAAGNALAALQPPPGSSVASPAPDSPAPAPVTAATSQPAPGASGPTA